jgi:hypothetical protein
VLVTKKEGSLQVTGFIASATGHDLTQTAYLKASVGSEVKAEMSGAGQYK